MRKIALAVLSILGLVSCAFAGKQPNIIFILADDLGYGDLGCYGQKWIATPNIDRLAAEGIRFTQAYAGGPVCTSSRSVLLTGLHGGHTPARDNVPHYPTYLDDGDVTLAEVLKGAGYRTWGMGKWSLGDPGTPGAALNQGFDHWFGYLNQDHAHFYFTEYLDDDRGRYELPGNAVNREWYSHDLLTERALEWIRNAGEKPFFLLAAYTLPHFSSKKEDEDGLAIPSTEPYRDRDWPENAKKYAAMVHRLDRDVGRIRDLIDQRGLSSDTLILFSSDNGGHSTVWKEFATSGPLRGYKRDLYEGGIRVPLIARWPGRIAPGQVSDEVVAFQDMLPTFASLAGAEREIETDGIDCTPVLTGGKWDRERPPLYWDYGHCRPHYDQAVRIGDWKGIRKGKEGGVIQLFDLSSDIGESEDLSGRFPEVVRRMEKVMDGAVIPDDRYPIGERYRGQPIWRAENHHPSSVSLPPPVEEGTPGFVGGSFIFGESDSPTPQCHASTLVELPDGNFGAAWFGGTKEPHVDNSIWFALRRGDRWMPPVEVVDGSEGLDSDHRTGNPVLFQPRGENSPLLLFYKVVPHEPNRASAWWGMLTESRDGGKTWSAPWKLGEDPILGERPHLIGPVKNKPVQLEDGTIFCPSSTEHRGWRIHFELTRDFGRTWEVIGPIHDARNFNAIQPSLLRYPDDRWQVLCRSREGVIAQSWSEDGGKTWGPVTATHLPNPNSGTGAVTLGDGRQLLVYHHTLRKGPFPAGREMLNVALSGDGILWTPVLTLERAKGEYSYPAVIQARDGRVHVTYTWNRRTIKHVVLDPEKL